MADLTSKKKKDWAKMLYLDTQTRYTQAEISEKVGVSKVTLSKWVNKEKWDSLRAGLTITRQQQVVHLYRQISDLNESIAGRPVGERTATSTEADTINKLATAISKLETEAGVADIVSVSIGFLNWLRKTNIKLQEIQEIGDLLDNYLSEKL
ncbi:MAG: DDE transposase family protein [Bacteroidales bacterium]|jgi:transcriptional regulator with XRE-family HTH domain|nr:DDE transposase family protein [Bacteroidales bacterium]